MFGPIIIWSAAYMQAFEDFCAAERFTPEWRAALAIMQAEAPQIANSDCSTIAAEDALMDSYRENSGD